MAAELETSTSQSPANKQVLGLFSKIQRISEVADSHHNSNENNKLRVLSGVKHVHIVVPTTVVEVVVVVVVQLGTHAVYGRYFI